MAFKKTRIRCIYVVGGDNEDKGQEIIAFTDGRMAMVKDEKMIHGLVWEDTEIIPDIQLEVDSEGFIRNYLTRVLIETDGAIREYCPVERPWDISIEPKINPDGSLSLKMSRLYRLVVEDLTRLLGKWTTSFIAYSPTLLYCSIKNSAGVTVATAAGCYRRESDEEELRARESLVVKAAALNLGIGERVYKQFDDVNDPLIEKVENSDGSFDCLSEYIVEHIRFDKNLKLDLISIKNLNTKAIVYEKNHMSMGNSQ